MHFLLSLEIDWAISAKRSKGEVSRSAWVKAQVAQEREGRVGRTEEGPRMRDNCTEAHEEELLDDGRPKGLVIQQRRKGRRSRGRRSRAAGGRVVDPSGVPGRRARRTCRQGLATFCAR